MEVKFCSLSSGSSGNCQYIETEKSKILIDAGFSGKRLEQLLLSIGVNPKDIDGIVVTHEHIDHVKGVGVFSRRYDLPIYANESTWIGMNKTIGKIQDKNIKIFKSENYFNIRDIQVYPINIFHDALEPVGYIFFYNKVKISIITDTGKVNDNIKSNIKNSNLYLLEANHDIDMLKKGNYPWPLKQRILSANGHLSNDDAAMTLGEIIQGNEEIVLLGHLSRDNNTPEIAYKTVSNLLSNHGIDVNKDIKLDLTYRDKATIIYNL
ncbi:MBL fold metallo-hydrolase [Tissierella praeacuta]|uniref:MBL fold metallo-hydrolase n=1 Tax=Tissierella praeacuta TaxID=43131 RepID=UPI000EE8CC50|nr:MBL fold metallo-hydrolase [Tissierella praeacuta]MBU5257128.1 MBL fold metallo-hydrolase [Tissierella praeacuta]HAE91461.1 MBL fold metallo-hydrolase [Tissierella sp.]